MLRLTEIFKRLSRSAATPCATWYAALKSMGTRVSKLESWWNMRALNFFQSGEECFGALWLWYSHHSSVDCLHVSFANKKTKWMNSRWNQLAALTEAFLAHWATTLATTVSPKWDQKPPIQIYKVRTWELVSEIYAFPLPENEMLSTIYHAESKQDASKLLAAIPLFIKLEKRRWLVGNWVLCLLANFYSSDPGTHFSSNKIGQPTIQMREVLQLVTRESTIKGPGFLLSSVTSDEFLTCPCLWNALVPPFKICGCHAEVPRMSSARARWGFMTWSVGVG